MNSLVIRVIGLFGWQNAGNYPRSLPSATTDIAMDRIISALGITSRLVNRALGGEPGETLCRRVAEAWGVDCLFFRLVGAALRQPDHCERELD